MKKLFTFILILFATSAAKAQDIKMTIYPNPATDSIVITTDSKDTLKVSLFDVYGRELVFHKMTFSQEIIKTDTLKRGMYFVRVYREADEQTDTKHLILR